MNFQKSFFKFLALPILSLYFLFLNVSAAPIHEAAKNGDLDEVKRILDADPDSINSIDEDNHFFYPLHSAVDGNQPIVIAELLRRGADPNSIAVGLVEVTPLHIAAARGYVDCVSELLKCARVDINISDASGNTVYHWVAMCFNKENSIQIIDMLDPDDAEINQPNNLGNTPLHILASTTNYTNSFVDFIMLLLRRGANINAQNFDGETPLSKVKNVQIRRLLTSPLRIILRG